MNWVLMLVLLVLACCAIYGYTKGFLRIVFSLVAWVIVLVFVSWATPHVSQWIQENTTIYEKIEAACEESVRRAAQGKMEEGAGEQSSGNLHQFRRGTVQSCRGTWTGSSGIRDGADCFGGFRRGGYCACGDGGLRWDCAEPGRIYRSGNSVCDGADSLMDSGACDLDAAWNRITYSDIKRREPFHGNVSGADGGTSYCMDCVLHCCTLQCGRDGESDCFLYKSECIPERTV